MRCAALAFGLSALAVAGQAAAVAAASTRGRDARLIASVERALRRNPKNEASAAHCRAATAAEIRRSPFGPTRRPVLRCLISFAGGLHENQTAAPAEAYEVQVLASGCFVAARVRPGRGDLGCGAIRVAARR